MADDKAQFSIYKIDLVNQLPGDNSKRSIKLGLGSIIMSAGYEEAQLSVSEINGYSISVFCKDRKNEGLRSLVEKIVKDTNKETIKDILKTKNSDLIILIYKNNECYGVSGGSGFFVLQELADEEFPIEIFKRSCYTSCKFASSRNTSGRTYFDHQIYRRMYQFDQSEVFGKIWGDIGGEIRDDSEIKEYLGETGIKSLLKKYSFKVHKKMTLEELVKLIGKISIIYSRKLTTIEENSFNFLNTLRPIKFKEKKNILIDEFLKEKIIKYIKGETDNTDIEFCSPNDVISFFCGSKYQIYYANYDETFEDYDIYKVLNYLKEIYSDGFSDDEILSQLKSYTLKISYLEGDTSNTERKYDLYKCFHGEFIVNNVTYFLVDGNVYKVYEEYIELLKRSFIEEVINDNNLVISNIPFANWDGIMSEGSFNEKHKNNEINNFLCCDRIFYEGSGGIELSDLLYEEGDNVYIIHVKKDLDGKTRDACSQIQNSSDFIERDRVNTYGCIKGLYKNIVNYNKLLDYRISVRDYFIANISEENFIKKFRDKNKIYVLAFMLPEAPNVSNINTFKSNIARNELILTKQYFKHQDRNLKICFITPTK